MYHVHALLYRRRVPLTPSQLRLRLLPSCHRTPVPSPCPPNSVAADRPQLFRPSQPPNRPSTGGNHTKQAVQHLPTSPSTPLDFRNRHSNPKVNPITPLSISEINQASKYLPPPLRQRNLRQETVKYQKGSLILGLAAHRDPKLLNLGLEKALEFYYCVKIFFRLDFDDNKLGCILSILDTLTLQEGDYGRVWETNHLFRLMIFKGFVPDVVTYNCLINGCCKTNRIGRELELFDDMSKRGCVPNRITYNSFIRYYSAVNEVDRAIVMLRMMQEKGHGVPTSSSCIPIIHTFCEVGRLDEAVGFMVELTEGGSIPREFTISTSYLLFLFDVTFPEIPCTLLSLDAMDISGEQHLNIKHDIFKNRIDSHGNVIETRQDGIGAPKIEMPLQRYGGRLEQNEKYCGSCFGAETNQLSARRGSLVVLDRLVVQQTWTCLLSSGLGQVSCPDE
ncbi:hypothetical protein ACS0TY_021457 [Phlomoides rotata]